MLQSIDPATGRVLATFPEADDAAAEAAIAKASSVRHGGPDGASSTAPRPFGWAR